MSLDKDLLLMSAARLYSLGVDVEAAREELRRLVDAGVPYESEEMLAAYNSFNELEQKWKELKTEHLKLRAQVLKTGLFAKR